MTRSTIYRHVQLIYDRDHGTENEGWYTRHDEYTQAGALRNRACDNALDAADVDDVEAALDEAVAYYGGRVTREDIAVID